MASNGTTDPENASTKALPHEQLGNASYLGVERVSQCVNLIKEKDFELQHWSFAILRNQFDDPNDKIRAEVFVSEAREYLRKMWVKLTEETVAVKRNFTAVLAYLLEHHKQLRIDVCSWKKEKRHYLLGDGCADALKKNLTSLKEKFEILEKLAVAVRAHIERYIAVITELGQAYANSEIVVQEGREILADCLEFQKSVHGFIHGLVQNGMILVEEPKSIVRIGGTKEPKLDREKSKIPFTMELRFLAGQLSGMIKENQEIETVIITEYQAIDIIRGQLDPLSDRVVPMGKIGGFKSICTIQAPGELNDGCMSTKFLKGRLQRIQKIASQEEAQKTLHHILFRIKQLGRTEKDRPEYLPFWTISLPFSAVSNANHQDKYRRALMFWRWSFFIDDATSEATSYDDPEKRVAWSEFFKYLNLCFKYVSKEETAENNEREILTRGLERHETHFKDIITAGQQDDLKNGVSWEMFYKRNRTGRSFWEWFHPAMDYVARNTQYWEKGYLLGFASRNHVEKLLNACKETTMVLKFSDTQPGMVVASHISWNATGQSVVEHVIFDRDAEKTFEKKPLTECISSSPRLQGVARIHPVGTQIPLSMAFHCGYVWIRMEKGFPQSSTWIP